MTEPVLGEDEGLVLVRPSDLATLRILTRSLELSGKTARRTGDDPAVILVLPPQHFREDPGLANDDLKLIAAAAPTTLAFSLPTDVDEFDLGEEGVLGLCELVDPDFDSPIAVPARATLAPLSTQWHLGSRPEVAGGRGSLWRAKLYGPVVGGALRGRLKLVAVHDAPTPVWDVLPAAADLSLRVDGVLEARRFDFSPIGVSARFRGPVDFGLPDMIPPEKLPLIDSYEHDIDSGRDSRVRVVSQGHLSSGHAASLIRLRRRVFIGGSPDIGFAQDECVTFLDTVNTIVVTDPVVDVEGLAAAYGGRARDMPFRSLRMLTTHVSGMDEAVTEAGALVPFWVQAGGRDFRFALQGTDWAGNVVPFEMPLVFIPGEGPFDQHFFAFFDRVYGQNVDERRKPGVGSVSIALVAPDTPAARDVAPLTVEEVHVGVRRALPGVTGIPVLPVLTGAKVVVDAAAHFSGVREAVDAVWDGAYRDSGLSDAAGDLGTYLQLAQPLTVDFGDPRRIGALAQPNMQVAALSVLKGAVPDGFDPRHPLDPEALKQLLTEQFATAKVLGAIPLTEIIDFARLGPPELKERVTRDLAELSYDFTSPITATGNDSVLQPNGPNSSIHLTAKASRRFADGATTTTINGTISQVSISLGGIVTLSFGELIFSADPGKGVTVDKKDMTLAFGGDLTFLQTLAEEVKKLDLGPTTIDVGADRITAGFSVTLPELSMGMFSLTNLSVAALLTVPFDGTPLRFTFGVGTRFKPFSVMVSLFTGGGFLALTMTSDGIEQAEASLEFGGSMQLNLVVASGGLSVMAGIYFRLDAQGDVTLGGYLRASGQVTVLGIITISADFFMQLSYESATKEAIGQASLTLGIKVLFFSKSVTLSVERRFSAKLGDPAFTDLYELEDWAEYCDAFA
jgi:hypothetical protein